MDGKIKKLGNDISLRLKSDVHIDSFGRALCELLQNSIDAGATNIIIKLDLESFNACVYDNGMGICLSEIPNLGRRYFTSKIRNLDDLKEIKTFGFRGEAIHSLINIADVQAFTKTKESNDVLFIDLNELGNKYDLLQNNKSKNDLLKLYELNAESLIHNGTIFIIRNFFKNNPVRRRIMKNAARNDIFEELMEFVLHSLIKLSPVKITIDLLDNESGNFYKKKVIDTRININKTIEEKYSMIMKSVFGSYFNDYVPISAAVSGYEINGLIGKRPCFSQKYQYIYINGLPKVVPQSTSNKISKLFANFGFRQEVPNFAPPKSNLSPKKKLGSPRKRIRAIIKFPTYLMNIRCESLVDERMQDPSKCIYKTKHWAFIERIILSIFEKFLKNESHIISDSVKYLHYQEPKDKRSCPSSLDPDEVYKNLKVSQPQNISYDKHFKLPKINTYLNESGYFSKSFKYTISKEDFTRCRIIRQIDEKFILLVLTNYQNGGLSQTLLLVDQHACDERIRVEEFLKEFISQIKKRHSHLGSAVFTPYKIPISSFESSLFEQYAFNFSFFGIIYTIENDILTISHLPKIIMEKTSMDLNELKYGLLEHLYCLYENKKKANLELNSSSWFSISVHLPTFIVNIINGKACRSSIMFGDQLNQDEMQFLMNKLQSCNLPFQCAHGRPVILPLVSTNDIKLSSIDNASKGGNLI